MDDQARAPWDHEAARFEEAADRGLRDPSIRAAWQPLLLPMFPEIRRRLPTWGAAPAP